MRRGLGLGVLIVALALALAGASAAAHKKRPHTRTVRVGDDYFSPVKLTVKKGTRIHWVWNNDNADSHDVRLRKGPKGVKRFHSQLAASDYSYSKTFTKPGTYRIYCSIHRTMRETIVVKR